MTGLAPASAPCYLSAVARGRSLTVRPAPLLAFACLPFALAALTARAVPDAPSNPVRPLGHVYLVRGQGHVFSGGWLVLRDRLRLAGLRAEDFADVGAADRVCADVLALRRAGRLGGPLVLVGHSRGGRQCLFAADRLRAEGVRVELLVAADVALPPRVPDNVVRAVNVLLTRERFYPAGRLRPAEGSRAVVENVDLDGPDAPFDPAGLHHLNFTDSFELRDYLFRRILSATERATAPVPIRPATRTAPAS